MENDFRIHLKFWGVRGSIATPVGENLGYGGNTTCIEVRTPGDVLIIDGGTGLRNLGMKLQQEFAGGNCSLAFLMTHFHWDHVQGLPFFAPLFSPSTEVTFRTTRSPEEIKTILGGQMTDPYFPVKFELSPAKKHYACVSSASFRQGGLTVHPFPLNHPQGATGYRMESGGAVVVHASDLEHGNPHLDRVMREYAQNADVLVFDAQYTPEEHASKRGWGHSTWLEATRVARDCHVGQLVLFHHDPGHDDAFLDSIVKQARRHVENTVAAKEGEVVGV